MKKQIVKKIISTTIVFIFAMFFLQVLSPVIASAANELNWENPNKNGKNPYKFKPKDVLNSQLIMQVVGCTGVVDKVSSAITGLVQRKSREALEQKLEDKLAEKIIKYCERGKNVILAGSSTAVNLDLTEAEEAMIDCSSPTYTKDKQLLRQMMKDATAKATADRTEQCFNGIAITLARNQLTAMTRYTVNWVNSGFNGDPMYVRNITSLTNSMERNVLETGIDILANDARKKFPYGKDFSRSLVTSYRTGGIKYGATNFLDSLASDLGSFVTDPRSYYSEENLQETPFERSTRVNYAFSNDFATGGWDGWLALTQRDQNNPLGFTMLASQYLADQEQQRIEETKQELLTNQGFLSQKRCIKWQLYDNKGNLLLRDVNIWSDDVFSDNTIYSTNKSNTTPNFDKCVEYETVTPGSLIKDKVSTYMNSPERQLEVADTINKSLNALFTALIARFQNQGLSSLSSEDYTFSNPNMGTGYGSNSLDSIDMFGESTSSGYTNGSFDLTRDLGNKYIHNYTPGGLGNWDANINKVWDANEKLNIGIGPRGFAGDPLTNVYYTVTVPGTTKLFENGYSGWAIGDKAFWDGSEWQNWKKGTANPIKERGVIQIQKDYIVAAKELLKKLPNIMPKIGELDYCIPGPNPSWESISMNAQDRLLEYVASMKSEYDPGSFWKLEKDGLIFSYAQPGDPEYDNYKNIFKGTSRSYWQRASTSHPMNIVAELGSRGRASGDNDAGAQNDRTERRINEIYYDLENFYKVFQKHLQFLYGDNLLKQYIENETTSELKPNNLYLPMAKEGLEITKNIISYDEDINSAIKDYNDSIVEANENIYKLDQIRSEVSKIILAAQERRDARLLELIAAENDPEAIAANKLRCDIAYEACSLADPDATGDCYVQQRACYDLVKPMTEAEYKTKYAACLEEEDILYMEDLEITNYENEGERCFDGLDNDRDGFVDLKDPDCKGNITQCNDGIDNDRDRSIDKNDPSCHIDGDIFKAYMATHNSETTFGGEDIQTGGTCIQDITTITGPRGNTRNCSEFNNVNKVLCEANVYHHDETKSTTCKWVPSSGGTGSLGSCSAKYEYSESPITENARTSCSTNITESNCINDYDIQIDTFSRVQRKFECEWTPTVN